MLINIDISVSLKVEKRKLLDMICSFKDRRKRLDEFYPHAMYVDLLVHEEKLIEKK